MSEIVKYEAEGLDSFSVLIESETVWLTQAQMSVLFDRDRTVINRHIHNVFEEGELDEKVVCANFAHDTQHGAMPGKTKTSYTNLYNLDVIISVGYRVKSQRGTQFRQWATKVLREHLLKGYTIKQPVSIERLNELHIQIGEILQRQNNADLRMHDMQKEFGRVYEIIHEITEQKRVQEDKTQKRIGF
jgi:hypothetical protein